MSHLPAPEKPNISDKPNKIESKIDAKIRVKKVAIKTTLMEFYILRLIILSNPTPYGKEIIQELKKLGVPAHEGTIYPLLSKLRREGLLEYNIEESDVGPPRKYYYPTGKAKRYYFQIQKFLKEVAG